MSHAPSRLYAIVDSDEKIVSLGAVKRQLEAMIQDNPNKGWKLRSYYNNEYWTVYMRPNKYNQAEWRDKEKLAKEKQEYYDNISVFKEL